MGIDDEPANIFRLQRLCQAGGVSAFRQPKPTRFAAECLAKLIASDCNLCVRRPRRFLQNRKNRMRRRTSHYLNRASPAELPKNSKQIAIPFLDKGAPCLRKKFAIELRERHQIFLGAIAFAFALRQRNQQIEMSDVAVAQERIG